MQIEGYQPPETLSRPREAHRSGDDRATRIAVVLCSIHSWRRPYRCSDLVLGHVSRSREQASQERGHRSAVGPAHWTTARYAREWAERLSLVPSMADASLPFEPVTDRELVERDEVLDALSGLLAGATHQGGRLVLLAGEAGIGKTSVVVELTRMWADRSLVLMGACDPLDTPRPLSPLLDIAADPQSGITDLVAAGVTGYDLYGAMVERLGGTVRPTLVVVEDIHWADDATLDFLRYLGRRVENTTAVVVATYRDDELGARPDLRRLLGDLATRRDAVIRVTLAALSVEAVALLAGRAGADAAEAVSIHRRTGGNPFYVTEVLAAGAGLPATVQDSVLARTSRLDPEAHRVVETVSVAPRSLEPGELEALMPGAEEAADRAVAAGVLDFDGAALRFRHELARSAVEAALAPMRRIDLHRSMVNLLVARESTDLARIVHHAVVVGDDPLVRSFAPPAAEQAIARGSIREAVRFYQIAVDRADEADARADLHAASGPGAGSHRSSAGGGGTRTRRRRAVPGGRRLAEAGGSPLRSQQLPVAGGRPQGVRTRQRRGGPRTRAGRRLARAGARPEPSRAGGDAAPPLRRGHGGGYPRPGDRPPAVVDRAGVPRTAHDRDRRTGHRRPGRGGRHPAAGNGPQS